MTGQGRSPAAFSSHEVVQVLKLMSSPVHMAGSRCF